MLTAYSKRNENIVHKTGIEVPGLQASRPALRNTGTFTQGFKVTLFMYLCMRCF